MARTLRVSKRPAETIPRPLEEAGGDPEVLEGTGADPGTLEEAGGEPKISRRPAMAKTPLSWLPQPRRNPNIL